MIIINHEFKSLIPDLLPEEYQQLEQNILAEGIRDPLVVWGITLIDGHNRYEIAERHGLKYKTVSYEFKNENDVKLWILKTQFGRRNLTDYDRARLALKLKPIIAEKAKERMVAGVNANPPQNSGEGIDWEKREQEEVEKIKAMKLPYDSERWNIDAVKQQVAKERRNEIGRKSLSIYFAKLNETEMKIGSSFYTHSRIKQLRGASPKIELLGEVEYGENAIKLEHTLKRKFKHYHLGGEVYKYSNSIFAEIIRFVKREHSRENETDKELAKIAGVSHDTISKVERIEKNAIPEAKEQVKRGQLSINETDKLARLEPEKQKQVIEKITSGEAKSVKDAINKPHVSQATGNNEWYTPKEYIEAARKVMGNIDLDPASNDEANKIVRADKFFTAGDNGLNKTWKGKVWLNPPYASNLIAQFAQKLKVHYAKSEVTEAIVLVNNATETTWFNTLIGISAAVVFPKSRVKFYMPNGETGAPLQGQAFIYIGKNHHLFMQVFKQFGWGAFPCGE